MQESADGDAGGATQPSRAILKGNDTVAYWHSRLQSANNGLIVRDVIKQVERMQSTSRNEEPYEIASAAQTGDDHDVGSRT